MNKIKERLNHFLFRWYYKRVPEHFHQWTFFKSVKLLIQNYKHQEYMINANKELMRKDQKSYDKLHKAYHDMRIKQVAKDNQIDWANKNLGMNIHKDTEN